MMTKFLLALNRLFPLPVHPFNLQNEGKESYAMWQYERGGNTIAFYTERYTTEEMFADKTVLDVGCGAGGKTMYYASQGVKKIVGMDIVAHYKEEAEALAEQLGYADRFTFVVGDAANTGFPDNSFDTIIMNDAMEHVDRPDLGIGRGTSCAQARRTTVCKLPAILSSVWCASVRFDRNSVGTHVLF